MLNCAQLDRFPRADGIDETGDGIAKGVRGGPVSALHRFAYGWCGGEGRCRLMEGGREGWIA